MVNEQEIYVGIDLGATNIRFILYNIRQDKIFPYVKKEFQSFGDVKEQVETNVCLNLEKVFSKYDLSMEHVKSIGIAMAPNFDRETGIIKRWPNHPIWEGFHLKDYLHNRWTYKIEILFEDDANGAAFGEYLYYRNRLNLENCVYITISTGVGGGFILNGKLYTGDHGWAGEIGHTIYGNDQTPCSCGKKGCLQALISGSALLKKFHMQYGNQYSVTSLKEVSILAEQGNDDAIRIFTEAGDILSNYCINLVELLDIKYIILGGGVLQQGGKIMIQRVKECINIQYGSSSRDIQIMESAWEDINGAIGALALVCGENIIKKYSFYDRIDI